MISRILDIRGTGIQTSNIHWKWFIRGKISGAFVTFTYSVCQLPARIITGRYIYVCNELTNCYNHITQKPVAHALSCSHVRVRKSLVFCIHSSNKPC